MCHKFITVVSNILSIETRQRDLLNFIGCDSVRNFIDHLRRYNCEDYDIDVLQRMIDACDLCEIERQERLNIAKKFPEMTDEEILNYKKHVEKKLEEFNRIARSLC